MHLSYIKNGKIHREMTECVFDRECDLCVAGLGTAGAIAAIAAASYGLDTVGVERCRSIGGLGVNGGVFSYYYGSKNGLFTEINSDCYKMSENGYMPSVTDRRIEDSLPPAVKNYVLNKYAKAASCDVYTDTDICGVYSEGRKIIGIKCIRENKIINIRAKIFVDCTSTAVLSRCFGCEMLGGREYDNGKMHYSKAVGKKSNYVCKDLSSGWFHHDYTHMPDTTEEMKIVGVWSMFGMPKLESAEKYTDSILDCSAGSPCAEDKFNDALIYLGSVPGERETYHVRTERVLSLRDVVYRTEFKEPLFYTFAPLDCTNIDCGFESPLFQDFRYCVSDMGFSVGIEKDVLIAKDADNLLVAGKIIGVDHSLAGGIRMKADMEKCGEAAAAAAFCAIANQCSVREAKYSEIKKLLTKSGCFNENDNKHFAELRKPLATERKSYAFPKTAEDIKRDFESTVASRSLWKAAYIWNDEERKVIETWIKGGSDTFKINCAIALGMSGSQCGRKILTDFINKAERVPPEALSGGTYSQYIKALSLAQRFCWTEVKDTMKNILLSFGSNIYPAEKTKFCRIVTSVCIRALVEFSKIPGHECEICAFLKEIPKPDNDSLTDIYNNIRLPE